MPTTPEENLFHQALTQPEAERSAWLDRECADDPALRARLEVLLAAHARSESLLSGEPEATAPTLRLDLTATPGETVGQTLGRYKLLERVGEGGCGVVFVAEQTEPVRRRVALKVIKLGMDTREIIARFEAERQALAMMDHPNIAKVLDAGTTDAGRPFFVMELVRGIRITDYCDQASLTTRERLDLFIKVCQAIQHAHQKGIIHRDIKPSNILVTLHDGVPVPKVIDFGIAKATEGRLTEHTVYTQLNQFIGTPAYMSPEQAEMSGLDIDTRSDIYSLGVLLYQLLTSKTPFDGKELLSMGLDAMRKTIREKEPIRPSTRLASLPGEERTTTAKRRSADVPKLIHLLQGDLDWIVMKCLEKDRTRRYETANGLAADIQRHLQNEPVVARPPSTAYRLQKAWQRNKLAFTAATAVALALVVGIGVSTWQMIRATRAEREKEALLAAANLAKENEGRQRHLAEGNAAKAEAAVTRLEIDRAEMLFEKGKSSEALAYLARVVRREPANRVASERILSALAHRHFSVPLFRLQANGPKPTAHFSSDGSRILFVSTRDGAQIRDGRTGQLLVGPLPHDGQILLASFNSNGTQVVTVSDDKTVRIWDAQTGQPITPSLEHESQVNAVDFSPDGKQLVTGSAEGAVRQWNAVTGEAVRTNMTFPGNVYHVKFSPDGQQILVGFKSTDPKPLESCRLIDGNNGTVIHVFDGYSGGLAPEFSPDGTRLLVSPTVEDLEILGPGFGSKNGIQKTLHDTAIRSLRFSPDGQYVAASALEGFATLLEATTLKPVGETMRHEHWVLANAFSPDGQRIATGSQDHTVRIWEARTGRSLGEPLRHDATVNFVQFSADGQRVLTVCEGGGVWVWEVRCGESLAAVLQHPAPVRKAVFSPGGERAASATMFEGLIRLWDTARARLLRTPLEAGMWEVQFSPDGRRVQGNNGTEVTVWDASQGEQAGRHSYGRVSPYTRFSPDGDLVVIGGPGPGNRTDSPEINFATVWRIADGERVARFPHEAPTRFALFSPDGRWVVSTSTDKTARLWNWKTGKELTEPLRHRDTVVWADVSSDSRRVLTLSTDKTACIWDASSGKRLHTLPHGGEPYHYSSAEFSADGRRVVIASGTEAQIWDADTGLPVTAVLPHPGRVQSVKFSPDGQRLLTACLDGTARLWDTTTGHPVSEPLKHEDRVNYAEFSPDGRRVITASHDGTSRIFELPVLTTSVPVWLADLAEAVAGQRLDERNASQPVPFAELHRLRQNLAQAEDGDEATRWAKWFLAENATRRISPGATLTVPQLVQQRIQDNTLESLQHALSLSPNNGLALARLAFLILTNTTTPAPSLVASLEWQSRHGVGRSPSNPDALWARSRFLDQVGRAAEANEAINRAASLNPTSASFWNERGLRLEQAGHLQEALQSFTKAIEHSGPWNDPATLPAQAYRNRRNVNRRLNRIAEATADHLRYRNLPARDPGTPATLIDLSPFYTAGTDIRLATGSDHNFTRLPLGRQKLATGTEFDIRGVIRAFQTESVTYQPTGIGVGQKGRKLYFLHVAAAWTPEDGKEVGIYRLHYADGQQREIPIRYGEHLRDQNPAWDPKDSLAPNSRLAWSGDTPARTRIRLFETVWENDRPDVAIQSLDVTTRSSKAEILLFAITVEP